MLRYQRDRKNFAKRDNVRFNLNEHNKRELFVTEFTDKRIIPTLHYLHYNFVTRIVSLSLQLKVLIYPPKWRAIRTMHTWFVITIVIARRARCGYVNDNVEEYYNVWPLRFFLLDSIISNLEFLGLNYVCNNDTFW